MACEERAAALDRKAVARLLASHEQLLASHEELMTRHEELQRQHEWLKRQLFGPKSERRLIDVDSRQHTLGEALAGPPREEKTITIPEHRRRRGKTERDEDTSDLWFDDTVPVEEVYLPAPGIDSDDEIITVKVTYRLAQRPGSYVVVRYIRPVVKRQDGKLWCAPAPPSVLGKSYADVSVLAGMVIDKFRFHLPLYRQCQRMEAAGIHLARSTLTEWILQVADLLSPIVEAQKVSILQSRVLTMDETPIKAGRKHKGRMQTGYFWPIHGDRDEIVFPFAPSRASTVVSELLGTFDGVLVSDGYSAYELHAAKISELVHAQCWAHARRLFVKAEIAEPELAKRALDLIGALYEEEAKIRRQAISASKKLELRALHCKPLVDAFFSWLDEELAAGALLPTNPFTEAANYTMERQKPLRVFLEYPDVPIDTNHLEREIRPIALGRKNWMFCWTEVGAEAVGILQSLLATCRLQSLDPYTYLVDVLQRVATHPASEVDKLTPRLWKQHFADAPMRSDIDRRVKTAES